MTEPRAASGTPANTIVDLLAERAARHGASPLYRFLDAGEIDGPCSELSFAGLAQRAHAIAAALQERGLSGQRVLLLYPPGIELLAAFFGCLCAGAVAVPAYPPDPTRLEQTIDRLTTVADDAQVGAGLTLGELVPLVNGLEGRASGLSRWPWLATDSLSPALASAFRRPDVTAESLAMIQYTSGSTSAPRGALLSHANLLHNSLQIFRRFRAHEEGTRGVIWLPPYHDMGLIGGILQPLFYGGPVTLMSPLDFLRRPMRWLEAISRERATISGGPNFAFDLCLRRIAADERARLDLSSWKVAFVGAEPVRAETLERFAEAFAPQGFRKEAFYPCYGLAEATLLVSGPARPAAPLVEQLAAAALERREVSAPHPNGPARAMVSCGEIAEDLEARIVDPDTRVECGPDRVGEIWLSGPSVVRGYWNQPEETERTFGAAVAAGDGRRYLRTGDLGFLRQGRLFVVGRLKDVIILRGRNHYPEDIERTVESSHPAIRPGCCAVFSVEARGEERPVVVVEIDAARGDSGGEPVADAVRGAVAARHELHVHAVVLAAPRSIPRTLSGKAQRQRCKAMLREGRLGEPVVWPPAAAADLTGAPAAAPAAAEAKARLQDQLIALPEGERAGLLERALLAELARVLSLDVAELTPTTPFFSLGLDSLMMTDLRYWIESQFTLAIPIEVFLQSEDPATLSAKIASVLGGASDGAAVDVGAPDPLLEAVAVSGPQGVGAEAAHAPSSRQSRLWHLDRAYPGQILDQITIVQRMTGELDIAALRRAFRLVIERHDLLRTVYCPDDGRPVVAFAPEQIELELDDLRDLPPARWSEEVRRRADAMSVAPFDLATGPLVRSVVVAGRGDQYALLLSIHHIVCDMKSIEVFFRDLVMAYEAVVAGHAGPSLPPLRLRFADVAARERRMLASDEAAARVDWWRRRLGDHPRLAGEAQAAPDCHASATSRSLPRRVSRSLSLLSQRHNAPLFLTLMTAFTSVLHRLDGDDDLLLHAHVVNRHSPDENALVGYFVNLLTVRFDGSTARSFPERLERTRTLWREAQEHQLPIAHLVRELRPDRYAERYMPAKTAFNMVPFAAEDMTVRGLRFEAPISRGRPTPFLFFDRMLIASPQQNGLKFTLLYNDLALSPRQAEDTADEFVEELDALAHGLAAGGV